MGATLRFYDHATDYERISRFLIETYQPGTDHFGNWLQPRWEYMPNSTSAATPAHHPIRDSPLPEDFRLQSLAEENDFAKIARCLHRGFHHEGEPPSDGAADRAFMQTAPSFRKDLTIVAVSPLGDYVSFGGMWFVPQNTVAYVEPVATDPDYRHMGLGRAVVLETVRRVAAEGASVVWVGSELDFHKAIGFTTMFRSKLWVKNL